MADKVSTPSATGNREQETTVDPDPARSIDSEPRQSDERDAKVQEGSESTEVDPANSIDAADQVDVMVDDRDLRDEAAPDGLSKPLDQLDADRPDGRIDGGLEFDETPAYDVVPDLAGTDPVVIDQQLEDILGSEDTSGGLDGRNDADLSSGASTGPNAEAPVGGLDGANESTLHESNVESINTIMNSDRSPDEKIEALDKKADEIIAAQEAAEQGGNTPGGEPGAQPDAELAVPGEGGDDGDGSILMDFANAVSEYVYDRPFMGEAGHDAPTGVGMVGGANKGATDGIDDPDVGTTDKAEVKVAAEEQIEENDGKREDQVEGEGVDLPDDYRDPSAGFGSEHQEIRWESALGGDVDPHEDDFGSDASIGSLTDHTDYVANYGEGYAPHTGDIPETIDDNIDHEFLAE